MTDPRTNTAEPPARVVPPPHDPVLRADADELTRALRAREITAVDLLDRVLARADEVGAEVNPFAIRLDERARRAAHESDRRIAAGQARPLEGVPVAAKDSQWMAGIATFSGTTAAPVIPEVTAGMIERVEAAGAVIFAKTTTSEYCYSGISWAPGFGHTRNPRGLDRTAGGSSGGSAAQVAAFIGPVGLGGDGGGSIRIPAAFCGVVGFKPTFGLVTHEPSGPAWKTLIGQGPLTRSVRDARLLMSVLAGTDLRDRHSLRLAESPAGRLRVAYSEDLGFAAVDDDVRACYRRALAALENTGAQLVAVPESMGFTSSVRTWATIAAVEARWAQTPLLEGEAHVSEQVGNFLAFGQSFSAEEYVEAQFERERLHARYVTVFAPAEEGGLGADVLFTPTVGCTAFDNSLAFPHTIADRVISEPWRDWASFMYDANLVGMPAMSVPIGVDRAGLPIGGHLVGARLFDDTVLRAGAVLEQALTP